MSMSLANTVPAKSPSIWLPRTYLAHEWVDMVEAKGGPKWVLQDFILAGGVTVISGAATDSYKTWSTLLMAMALASGKKLGGFEPNAGPTNTWFIEAESPERSVAERFRRLELGTDTTLASLAPKLLFSHIPRLLLDDPKSVKLMTQFAKEQQIKVVFFDTLAKSHGGDENSAKDMQNVFQAVDQLRALGCAVVIIHHVTKTPKDADYEADDALRGSSAIAGAYDVHLHIRSRLEGKTSKAWEVKSNEDETKYFHATWYFNETATWLTCEKTDGLTTHSRAALDKLIQILVPEQIYTMDRLVEIWHLDKKAIRALIDVLIEEGTLITNGRSRWMLK